MPNKVYFSATGKKSHFGLAPYFIPLEGGTNYKVPKVTICLNPDYSTADPQVQKQIEDSPYFGTKILTEAPKQADAPATVVTGPATLGGNTTSEFQTGKDFGDMPVKELRAIAQSLGVSYNGLNKEQLVEALEGADGGSDSTDDE